MKGQASLETLLIATAFISCFILILPQINSVKNAGQSIIIRQNAEMIKQLINFNCEKSLILGKEITFAVKALDNINLSTNCSDISIPKGKNLIRVNNSKLNVVSVDQNS